MINNSNEALKGAVMKKTVEWRKFDEYYWVSSEGDVKSFQQKEPRILKWQKSAKYFRVRLYGKWNYIHRLVGLLFIDNPLNKPCINHLDGIRSNNVVSNLEWVTHKENSQHYFNILLPAQKRLL